jgi:hypothetical protein
MTWNDLTLRQYQKLVKIEFDGIDSKPEVEQLKTYKDVYEIVTGKKNFTMEELLEALPTYDFLFLPPETLNWEFKHDGKVYACNGDVRIWTVAQFLNLYDLVNGKTHSEILDELHKLLAIFYTEVIDGKLQEYDNDKKDDYVKIILNYMPADVAYSASLFFYLLSAELSKTMIQHSVEEVVTQLSLKHLEDSMNSTDYTALLKMRATETLPTLKEFISQTSTTSSSGQTLDVIKPE